jgi:hypothetical protein
MDKLSNVLKKENRKERGSDGKNVGNTESF